MNDIDIRAERHDPVTNAEFVRMLHRVLHELSQLRNEVRTLAKNDAQLTQVVTRLVNDGATNTSTLQQLVTALTTANANDDDQAQDAAITALGQLADTMEANTAAAQQALATLNGGSTGTGTSGDGTTGDGSTGDGSTSTGSITGTES